MVNQNGTTPIRKWQDLRIPVSIGIGAALNESALTACLPFRYLESASPLYDRFQGEDQCRNVKSAETNTTNPLRSFEVESVTPSTALNVRSICWPRHVIIVDAELSAMESKRMGPTIVAQTVLDIPVKLRHATEFHNSHERRDRLLSQHRTL